MQRERTFMLQKEGGSCAKDPWGKMRMGTFFVGRQCGQELGALQTDCLDLNSASIASLQRHPWVKSQNLFPYYYSYFSNG